MRYLNFVCPTDCLEITIEKRFRGDNYFFTSLGNSISFDYDTVDNIISLIKNKQITDINFILSDKNRILLDAIHYRNHKDMRGLGAFYHRILDCLTNSNILYKHENNLALTISYFLNDQINNLVSELKSDSFLDIRIKGWIYHNKLSTFSDILPDMVYQEKRCLN